MKGYLALITAWPLIACTCGPQAHAPACERWDRVQVAFLGTVIERNGEGFPRSFVQGLRLVHIDEAFKGLGDAEREVFIDTSDFCGSEYDLGKQYVFFAGDAVHRRQDLQDARDLPLRWNAKRKLRVFTAGVCSGSQEAFRSAEDLAWLRTWRSARTRVYGLVLQNFAGQLRWAQPDGLVALPFAPVSLMGENGNYSAKTDIDGRYSIESIKPGTYVLTASRFPWRLEKGEMVEITEARPCAQRALNMRINGVIRGRVITSTGLPAKGIDVELVRGLPDGKLPRFAILKAKTDATGRFVMEKVPSAAFAIGVNLVSPPTASAPYQNVRFPRMVEVAPDGQVNNVVIKLPPPLKDRLVTVKVFWNDGTPVADRARVWAVHNGNDAASEMAQRGNIVTLRLLQGLSYRLHADRSSLRQGGGEYATAEPITLPAGEGPVSVEIRLRER